MMSSSLKVGGRYLEELHRTFSTFSGCLGDHILFQNVTFLKRSQNIRAGIKDVI